MNEYKLDLQIRWADLDANAHLRHSVYYDWGSYCRIHFLNAHGLSTKKMHEQNIGPVLFREECIFKKEVLQEDKVSINVALLKSRKDFSRWSMRHVIFKNDEVAAIINIDGAWMDTIKRKLCTPPLTVGEAYHHMPLAEDFVWL